MNQETLTCLVDMKDVMMALILHYDDIAHSKTFRRKWMEKSEVVHRKIEGLDRSERKELDKEYELWYSTTLKQLVPESIGKFTRSDWYK